MDNLKPSVMVKKLTLSTSDKKLCGVCSGFAKYFDLDPVLIRVIWLVLALCCGVGLLAYIICWAVMPSDTPNTNVDVQ